MMTVHEVSKLTGVSIRALHHYDRIGLLRPACVTEAGYRQYDDTALERLQQILLFRELDFPLKEIQRILASSGFDRNKALEQQIELLKLKKERLEKMIEFACEIRERGIKNMDFTVFDTTKMEEYARQAKEQWGKTDAYKEFESRNNNQSDGERKKTAKEMMDLFAEFGGLMNFNAEDGRVQAQVRKLQDYITQHFYTCTPEILRGLGEMYAAGNEFTQNIDQAGGAGCAQFVCNAINVYCG